MKIMECLFVIYNSIQWQLNKIFVGVYPFSVNDILREALHLAPTHPWCMRFYDVHY